MRSKPPLRLCRHYWHSSTLCAKIASKGAVLDRCPSEDSAMTTAAIDPSETPGALPAAEHSRPLYVASTAEQVAVLKTVTDDLSQQLGRRAPQSEVVRVLIDLAKDDPEVAAKALERLAAERPGLAARRADAIARGQHARNPGRRPAR